MKKAISLFLLFYVLIIFSACRDKNVILLTKKWDCVQVENIVPPNTKSLTATDSFNLEKLKTVLQSITWTFKNNMRYECAIGDRITVHGKYELVADGRIMICTPESKNGNNRYIINSLTTEDLVLEGNAENTNVVLHFKSH